MTARPTHPARPGCLSLLMVLATACGGGGGDDPPPAPAANQPPLARISAADTDGFAPLTVTFDAGASRDPDGSISRYLWDFGDESSTATGVSVTHTFDAVGSYTVALEVTDDDGRTASASRTVRARGAMVSGVVQIAPGSSIDSDVNDRLTTPVSNNGFGAAQAVDTPLRLGGFVNVAGTGADGGNFRESGDGEDIFAVELEGDERVVLSIGDPSADLDLQIYSNDPQPVLLDASVSPDPANDPTEDLRAPADGGRFFVRVVAVSGASNYVLRINDETEATAGPRRAKRLTDPFVPGEVLTAQSRRARVQLMGLRPAHAGSGMRLESLDTASGDSAAAGWWTPDVQVPDDAYLSPAMRARYRTLLAVRHLGTRYGAALAEVNVLRQPMRVPNDPLYERQWHYRSIGLEQAWDISTSAASVVVAVVDNGVLLEHPDLRNRLLRDGSGNVVGYDFIQDPQRANDGDGLDPDPDDPGDDERGPGEGSFHGTHVAGTVAAETNNGAGVAGVAWNARIMPLRALGIDGGTTFDVLQAIRFAAGLNNVSGTRPPVRADIINLSLGSDFYSESEQQTINEVRSRGVFLVASAGNAGSTVPSYPATYDGVISVAATRRDGSLASYSNNNSHVDMAAPGGQFDAVLSTLGAGGNGDIQLGYGALTGTSMAAPHVSGVIALMKSLYPELTPGEFDQLLRGGSLTDDAGPAGRDDGYGWGVINAFDAVLAAQQASGGTLGPIISVSVGTLNFQGFTRQLDFAINNAGDRPVDISVTEDASWLTITPLDVMPTGFGQYRATVDRSNLAPGTYEATVVVREENSEVVSSGSLVPTVFINVVLSVSDPDASADAGQHYVILVGSRTEEAVATQVVTAREGRYEFSLEDVPPGEYRLFAGTDLDDDDFICDGGEACGAFPSLSDPEVLSIHPADEPTLRDLTFASEFRTTATTTAAQAEVSGAPPPAGLQAGKPTPGDP